MPWCEWRCLQSRRNRQPSYEVTIHGPMDTEAKRPSSREVTSRKRQSIRPERARRAHLKTNRSGGKQVVEFREHAAQQDKLVPGSSWSGLVADGVDHHLVATLNADQHAAS